MKFNFLLTCVFTLFGNTVCYSQACDDFNMANTTDIPNWTEQIGNWIINGNKLASPSTAQANYITFNGSNLTNGCITATATYPTSIQIKAIGLMARYSSETTNIYAKIQDNNNSGYWDSYFIYNNGVIASYLTGKNFGKDAKIQFEFNGTAAILRIDTNKNETWDYTYNTTLTNTDPGLCGIVSYNQVYIDDYCYGTSCCQTPLAAGSISGSSSVCEEETGVIYSVPEIDFATSYLWNYTGNNTTIYGNGRTVAINFSSRSTSGTLTVKGINSCGEGLLSPTKTIVVNPLPLGASIISGQDTVCKGTTGIFYSTPVILGATSYEWKYSGQGVAINGNGSGITLDFSTVATSGSLIVEGYNSCGSGSESAPFQIFADPCTAIDNISIENKYHISPNPSIGTVDIKINSTENSTIQLKIVNLLGVIIAEKNLEVTNDVNSFNISFEDNPNGLYYLNLIWKDKKTIKPIILVR